MLFKRNFDMTNPLIPKDNYVSRIAESIRKEDIKRVLLNQYKLLDINPQDLHIFISKNIDLPTKDLVQKVYDEFFNDVNKELKEWRNKK